METKQHVLWEINRWMDTYVRPAVSPVKGSPCNGGACAEKN